MPKTKEEEEEEENFNDYHDFQFFIHFLTHHHGSSSILIQWILRSAIFSPNMCVCVCLHEFLISRTYKSYWKRERERERKEKCQMYKNQ